MRRYLEKSILEFIHRKIILVTGPRQTGKTTLTKALSKSFAYYNYDIKSDLDVFRKNEWDRTKKIVIFDELHKKNKWKLWLKGIYDQHGTQNQGIVVTGSAKLDLAKKVGDSLAGRFFSYRLYPFDLKELKGNQSLEKNYNHLLQFSGFPEPFLEASPKFYGLWAQTHSDLIIRQDLLSSEVVRDLDSLEVLVDMLSTRVGSTVSINSLAVDLQKDDKTIRKWLDHLENLYVVFRVNPYSKNIPRGLLKAGKYYFYDIAKVRGKDPTQTEAARLENLVALSLKKEVDFLADTEGKKLELYFSKFKGQQEMDFMIFEDKLLKYAIEVRLSDDSVSDSFRAFQKHLDGARKIQLVRNLKREFSTPDGVEVVRALDFLENLRL